jgi:hypothetical protein
MREEFSHLEIIACVGIPRGIQIRILCIRISKTNISKQVHKIMALLLLFCPRVLTVTSWKLKRRTSLVASSGAKKVRHPCCCRRETQSCLLVHQFF